MITTFTLKRTLSGLALVSAFTLSGCQKEELMEEQFAQPASVVANNNGQPIPGQYIVVFKNGSINLNATGVSNLSIAGRASTITLRQRLLQSASVDKAAVAQTFEGAVNGFAARLDQHQLDLLRKNPEVAYVEQDRIISLAKPTTSGGGNTKDGDSIKSGGSTKGGGKKTPTEPAPTEPAPVEPTPVEPAPTEPAPTEPVPTEPTPTEPTPTEPIPAEPTPTEPAPAYTKITPLLGETLPWNVSMTGFGDGTGKTVWVIDSGIDTDHPDLNVDMTRSASMIYNNPSIEDGFGHGTSVAGVIAAKNNGSGMVGVAANATIVAVRVFDDAGAGTMSRAISAVNYVINNAKAGDVVNMSLGGSASTTLDDAVKLAASKGILFAIASGNSGVDCAFNSPARVDATGVYTVSAMDKYMGFWSSSNFGAAVDFTAPGVNVTVTKIGGGIASGAYGTSYAAPHVAGILLLRGAVYTQGLVSGDKDSWPDPIASVE
ncbi:aqualysin 1 [Pontibacter sp. HJ8]